MMGGGGLDQVMMRLQANNFYLEMIQNHSFEMATRGSELLTWMQGLKQHYFSKEAPTDPNDPKAVAEAAAAAEQKGLCFDSEDTKKAEVEKAKKRIVTVVVFLALLVVSILRRTAKPRRPGPPGMHPGARALQGRMFPRMR
mmetsp:Transcript_84358/g.225426  ORF Transcript_84358/g.225426 Transcript_84358/m.225426 type:complete len:141 (+) Transcript_84358:3-425(+)